MQPPQAAFKKALRQPAAQYFAGLAHGLHERIERQNA
jgi:hypothetical protein